jgi:hypothetical protein
MVVLEITERHLEVMAAQEEPEQLGHWYSYEIFFP